MTSVSYFFEQVGIVSSVTIGNRLRAGLGLILWLSLAVWAALGIRSQTGGDTRALSLLSGELLRWLVGVNRDYSAAAESTLILAPNDPIFLKNAEGRLVQIGRVRTAFGLTQDPVTTQSAILLMDEQQLRSVCPGSFSLEYHTTPTSLDWVAKTLISPDRRDEIAEILARDWKLQSAQVLSRLEPILVRGLQKIAVAVEAELPAVLDRHRPDFARLADRYQGELVQQKIVPLVRQEILPIVEQEIRPVALQLGRELWDRVSLWSFTWRYLYDVSPLPERNAVRREFERFLADEVTPALESRTEIFVAVTERIVARISANQEVRRVVRESLRSAATDAELQKVVGSILHDLFLDNSALHRALKDYLAGDEVRSALEVATSNFEPSARAIGTAVFGSRTEGITAEFSRVMRTQILLKDRRWLVVVPESGAAGVQDDEAAITIRFSVSDAEFPLEFEGGQQSPLTVSEQQP
jgi:hypothetical protein